MEFSLIISVSLYKEMLVKKTGISFIFNRKRKLWKF